MAQQLRVLTANPEDLCLVPSTHIGFITTTCNPSPGDLTPSLASLDTYIHLAFIHTGKYT